jgi:hypothetical protein
MSKSVMRHKREQEYTERQKQQEEMLSRMTQEERKAYENKRRRVAVEALSSIAAFNSFFGENKYY